MLWQISDHAPFKKDLIYLKKLLSFQISVKNKTPIFIMDLTFYKKIAAFKG